MGLRVRNGLEAKLQKIQSTLQTAHDSLVDRVDLSGDLGRIERLARQPRSDGATSELYRLQGRRDVFYSLRGQLASLLEWADTTAADFEDEEKEVPASDIDSLQSLMEELLPRVRDHILSGSLNDEYDQNNAIITIDSRASSNRVDDAREYIDKLVDSYTYYARSEKMGVDVLHPPGSSARTMIVEGGNAYGLFKGEHGKHVIRYLARRGKVQAHHINVTVEAELPATQYSFDRKDLRIETIGASTPGGQHANRNGTCVRITHLDSDEHASAHDRRRIQSERKALRVLRSRVAAYYEGLKEHVGADRVRAGRGGYKRSYNLVKRYINDSGSGIKSHDVDGFFRGDIGPFIQGNLGINF